MKEPLKVKKIIKGGSFYWDVGKMGSGLMGP